MPTDMAVAWMVEAHSAVLHDLHDLLYSCAAAVDKISTGTARGGCARLSFFYKKTSTETQRRTARPAKSSVVAVAYVQTGEWCIGVSRRTPAECN